jgi:hypothetical protein
MYDLIGGRAESLLMSTLENDHTLVPFVTAEPNTKPIARPDWHVPSFGLEPTGSLMSLGI